MNEATIPAVMAARLVTLQEERDKFRQELSNIVKASRSNKTFFADDTEFADWAQSRARHALYGNEP